MRLTFPPTPPEKETLMNLNEAILMMEQGTAIQTFGTANKTPPIKPLTGRNLREMLPPISSN
jgi:hypothetical protein